MDNRKAIKSLLSAYLMNRMSRDEFDELIARLAALDDADFREAVRQVLDDGTDLPNDEFIQQRVDYLYPLLLAKVRAAPHVATHPPDRPIRRLVWWKLPAAAAIVLMFLLVGNYLWRNGGRPDATAPITAEQIVAGGDRATLTLADGRTIDLNAAQRGIAVGDGIRYLDGTEVITLDADGERPATNAQLLTLSTAKGGQYQLALPDGTKVWLNAASSLVYPDAFGKDVREVTLQGEAYFEVAKERDRPFIVNTARQRVAVLGTSFNINAYGNENFTKTTLLSGSVRVNATADGVAQGEGRILAPNQQSVIGHQGNDIAVNPIDPFTALAWKDGLFNFHGLNIDEAMKQIERWYDISVRYNGAKPEGYLGGKMSRGVRLSTFLDFLERDFGIKSELKADRTLVLYVSK